MMLFIQEVFSLYIEFPHAEVKIEGMEHIEVPGMLHIRQRYDPTKIDDLAGHLTRQLEALPQQNLCGKRIAVTAGSRGIPHIALLYRTVCAYLRRCGAEPFLVPAMGSHGGGTAEGQTDILAAYGLTEESVGAPIRSCMDVVEYGRLDNGTHLYCDRLAAEADGIVVMNKVKPHTDFRAEHESGLTKMIAIGIAKHKGATEFHRLGFEHFAQRLPQAAEQFLQAYNVPFAVGIVQNAYDEICTLEAAPGGELLALDAKLLREAKQKIPRLKCNSVDVLIIDRIGKEISGFGADPNVTGRTNGIQADFAGVLDTQKIFIAGLTETTHHNGSGIGAADLTTRRCLNSIDWGITWTNLITSGRIKGANIPMYLDNDRDAIRLAIRTCAGINPAKVRIARIRTTLDLNELQVSPALYEELCQRDDVELLEAEKPFAFDADGFMLPF